MEEYRHTAAETIALFATRDSANGTAATEQQRIEQLAARLGLGRARLSALRAVMTWAVFLRPSTEPQDRECLRNYLDVMGYLPADRKVVACAERSRDTIDRAVPTLLEGFARGDLDPETFLDAEAGHRSQRLAGLTRSQLELLKSILRHQQALDAADLRDLVAQFPFPITRLNFFGRFIAGGCDDPGKAVRYLRLCTPFFVRLRSLLEGLSNDRYRFLVVQGMSGGREEVEEEEETEDSPPDDKRARAPAPSPAAVEKEVAELLLAAIDHAHDFVDGADAAIPTPFACIKVPELPDFLTDHVDRGEQTQLAAEFMDWLLTGNRDGALLHRKALSIERERDYRKARRDLRLARLKRRKHHRKTPQQDDKKAMSIWEREDARLARTIEDLEYRIKQDDRERARRKTILQQLDAAEAGGRTRIRKFREETARARQEGKRIVFTLLGGVNGAVFCKYLDRAFSAPLAPPSSSTGEGRGRQGVRWLRTASILLSPSAAQQLRDYRIQGFGSVAEQQLRDFPIVPAQMGPSLRFVLQRILPEKIDPKVGLLIDALLAHVRLPGAGARKHLTYLVRKWSGKKEPKAEDYLCYAFEHAAFLGESDLQAILRVLRELGFSDVPVRCKELSVEAAAVA
jgi:hypothetical protein